MGVHFLVCEVPLYRLRIPRWVVPRRGPPKREVVLELKRRTSGDLPSSQVHSRPAKHSLAARTLTARLYAPCPTRALDSVLRDSAVSRHSTPHTHLSLGGTHILLV